MKHFILFLLTLAVPVVSAAQPSPAAPSVAASTPATRLEKPLAVDVRRAPLADVLARASEAAGVRMAASGAAGDQRVTLHAARTTAGELQGALRSLLRLRVSRRDADGAEQYTLPYDTRQAAQAEAWRLRQADTFLQDLLRTASALAAGKGAETTQAVRTRFHQAHPEFSDEMLEPVDAEYLQQSLLLAPLTPVLRGQLVQTGWLSLPVAWLAPSDQGLLIDFARARGAQVIVDDGLALLGGDLVRLQCHVLYGDRWTGRMLLAQVGVPGAWQSAMLPSILFRQQDASALYPQAAERPDDPDVWRRLPPRFETAGKDWDTVLGDLATTMEIKLAADSYARPWLFNTDRALPPIAGIPLRDALDRLCQEQGYFWWKQDGWYLLRSRNWVEESRVAVPDRLLRGWLASVRANGALTIPNLAQLATLTGEQLLTLNLESRPPGEVDLLGPGFDPDEAALAANGLQILRSLPPAQQELALGSGLPALWMPPAQQSLFAAVAAQSGAPLLPENAESWGFRVHQSWPAGVPISNLGRYPQMTQMGADGEGRRMLPSSLSVSSASSVDNVGNPKSEIDRPIGGSVTVEWQFAPGEMTRASVTMSDRSLHRTEDSPNPPEAR